MQRNKAPNLKYLILPMVVVLSSLLLAGPVQADSPGFRVNRLILKTAVTPGSSKTLTMLVSTTVSDPVIDIELEVQGVGQSLEGAYQGFDESEDTNLYSAREFITATPERFSLEPGGSQEVTVRIDVPQEFNSGGRYAITYVRGKVADQEPGIGTSCAVGIPVVLFVKDSELTKTGMITDFHVAETTPGRAVDTTAVFKNTGNYHYRAWARATLRSEAGLELVTATTPLTTRSIMPDYAYRFNLPLTVTEELLPADYYVEMEVLDEKGNVLDIVSTQPDEIGIVSAQPETNRNLIGGILGGSIGVVIVIVLSLRRRRNRYSSRSRVE